MLRLVGGPLTRESEKRLPRSLAEGERVAHDPLGLAKAVATAKHNGLGDFTCEDNVVGTVFLYCHATIIAE